MRPDQHKKKQSAAYKKKHGLKDSDNKAKRGEKSIPPKDQPESSRDKVGQKTNSTDERKYVDLPEFSSSDEEQLVSRGDTLVKQENRGVVQPGKRFQKRQIVSNWSRYEGQGETQGEKDLRGADFSQLLQSAGDAVSQFRFRDEEDWESSEDAQFFALDVNDLAQAVKCVPLHERLNVEGDNFPQDMKKVFEEDSLKYSLLYGQSMDEEINQSERLFQNPDVTSTTIRSLPDKSLSHVPHVNDVAGVNSQFTDTDLDSEQMNNIEHTATLDNIIEGLLSKTKSLAPEPGLPQTAKETESLASKQESSQSPGSVSEPASENLEDWLDSVI